MDVIRRFFLSHLHNLHQHLLPARPTIPSNFDDVYAAIQQYRKTHTAPVDTIGCGWLADRELAGPEFRFQTLTALLLSSQTTDERNAAAIERLKALPDGLNPPSIIATETQTLEDILRGVSFHKRKAVYLKETAKMVLDKFEGDVPNTLEGLLEFPGVGPKMAYLALQCCWDISVGIGVDTHVHRIANKLGWVSTKKTEPESTRKELEDWLPKKYWAEINPLLVGFGQTCCTAVKPHCDSCPVADYCPKKSFKK
ncbi:DNA glycosylase [Rhizoclosmatium globosum]|uniref:Endonuclease III homolog n=1 Tax=Rhizoclosmatium globosum TaxID=329046 RepID=A0A1Y2D2X4_9FUNG|nr:DNA glycosylase [Rhizoclosmatium globosum]|eukprot:ORY53484.1 DNA glycosylase [Rhizoclosmatium globosum]